MKELILQKNTNPIQSLKIYECYNKLHVKTWIQFFFSIKPFDKNLGTIVFFKEDCLKN